MMMVVLDSGSNVEHSCGRETVKTNKTVENAVLRNLVPLE